MKAASKFCVLAFLFALSSICKADIDGVTIRARIVGFDKTKVIIKYRGKAQSLPRSKFLSDEPLQSGQKLKIKLSPEEYEQLVD